MSAIYFIGIRRGPRWGSGNLGRTPKVPARRWRGCGRSR